MFKNDEEFDDVAQYKKSRNDSRELEEKYTEASRFEKRDDYVYDEVHEDHMEKDNTNYQDEYQRERPSQPQSPQRPKKKKTSPAIIILIIIGYVLFRFVTGFLSMDDSESTIDDITTETRESSEEESTVYDDYVMKNKDVNATEFVKEYQVAKKNRINYNRIQQTYVSGDYSKSYVINSRYTKSKYADNYDKEYYCLLTDNKAYNENEDILSCGLYGITKAITPKDALNYFEEKGIKLYNYDLYESESPDYYNINGFFYSKEFCDLVVEYAKDKTV